nr:MAG TPA: hypothetical protein [Caudoviricetes sp.]
MNRLLQRRLAILRVKLSVLINCICGNHLGCVELVMFIQSYHQPC